MSCIEKIVILDVLPKNLGLFIGKSGSNFKRMIVEMKKKIIGKEKEISSEEWNSIIINLKFVKTFDSVEAVIKCKDTHLDFVKEVLKKYEEIHNKEIKKYKKIDINNENILTYKVGISEKYLDILKGEHNSNIYKLKIDISKVPLVNSIISITIEKYNKYYQDKYIYIGDKESKENIMIFVKIKGNPEIKYMNSVIQNFIDKHTQTKIEESEEEMEESEEEMEDEDDELKDIFNNIQGNIYDMLYRWDHLIGKNIEYGYYSKNSQVERIKRAVSC